MAKIKTNTNQLIEKLDIDNLQEFREEQDNFIVENLLEYTDLFVGTNFQCIQQVVPSMNVEITLGKGLIDSKMVELLANEVIAITAAGGVDRTDLITCDAALTDDATAAKLFIDPITEVVSSANVVQSERYVPTFYYYTNAGAGDVPSGEVGIAVIDVDVGTVAITTALITDIRPAKSSSDLAAHVASNPIDHAAGSISDVAISATADIGTLKIDGISCGTLNQLLLLGLPLNSIQTITYNVDDLPSSIVTTGDASFNTTITYNSDDTIASVAIEDAISIVTISIVWVGGLPTTVTTAVVDKP